MKKLTVLPIIFCLLLAGCTAKNPAPELTETSGEATVINYILDESSVHNAFKKALEVYGWFDLCSIDIDSSKAVTVNDTEYYKTVNSEVSSYNELRTLVYSLFSVETGDMLLKEGANDAPYIDINGDLYGKDFARGTDITKGEYTAEVEYLSNTSVLYKVRVEIIDFDEHAGIDNYRKVVGYEDYTYHYEYINNKWVFTDFSLFY